MAAAPHRPFVPHRTPTRERPAVGASEFRLARPFIPGTQPAPIEKAQRPPASAARAKLESPMQPIEDFLHPSPRSPATDAPATSVDDYAPGYYEEGSELPPVEHFLDPLPREDQGAEISNAFDSHPTGNESPATGAPPSSSLAEEWASTDWQQYDWRSLAALGESGEVAATNAWAETDWEGTGPRADRESKKEQPAASQAIARALDQIAQQIRDGELSGSAADPAAIAATLAALLRLKK